MIADFFTLAFRNMKKKRLRAFLTLVGILISIATIFIVISLSLGLSVAIQEQFEKLGTDKFFIQAQGQFGPPGSSTAVQMTEEDVDVVEGVSGVKDITSYIVGNAKIKLKDTQKFVIAIGFEPDKMDVAFGNYGVEEGRKLKNSGGREALLGYNYRHTDFLGRQIEIGDTVLINDIEFKVVGIIEQLGNAQDDRNIYISKEQARELFNIPERVDQIVVQVDQGADIDSVVENVDRRLIKSRDLKKDNKDFTILTPEELQGAFENVIGIIRFFLVGVAAISLLVGGINIANSMFTSVLERTKEIGVMKAIGAKNSDILIIFIIEAGFLGIVGGGLGVLFGMAVGKTIEYVAINQLGTTLLKVVFPAYLILGSLLFAFLAGAISGLWPAWKATKIKPVEALRYE